MGGEGREKSRMPKKKGKRGGKRRLTKSQKGGTHFPTQKGKGRGGIGRKGGRKRGAGGSPPSYVERRRGVGASEQREKKGGGITVPWGGEERLRPNPEVTKKRGGKKVVFVLKRERGAN